MLSTSPTLLEKLRQPTDREAWLRFVQLYTPLLLHWAGRQGFQEADAADVVQEVLVKLLRALPEYHRGNGQTFRGWLSRIVVNQTKDFRRRRATRAIPHVDDLPEREVPSNESEIDESEYRSMIIRRARDLIKNDFNDQTWAAFTGVWLDGLPAKEVAAKLSTSINAVYLACNRVLMRLRQVIDGLMD